MILQVAKRIANIRFNRLKKEVSSPVLLPMKRHFLSLPERQTFAARSRCLQDLKEVYRSSRK